MKRIVSTTAVALAFVLALSGMADAQVKWMIGGRIGISIGSLSINTQTPFGAFIQQAQQNTSSTSAGLQIGPTAEVVFSKQFAIVTEFNINTQAGTPIEWANCFKVYFPVSGSKILPYADAGFDLLFITGGPFFGVRGGGGALFPIAPNLYIPADLQLGPIFATGATLFWISGTTGIRYIF